MPSEPVLPEPAHADVDSMLSRKFGKEVANYFSGMETLSASLKICSTTVLITILLQPKPRRY